MYINISLIYIKNINFIQTNHQKVNDILESLVILLLNNHHTDSQVKVQIEYLVTSRKLRA